MLKKILLFLISISIFIVFLGDAYSGEYLHYQDLIHLGREAIDQGLYEKAILYFKLAHLVDPAQEEPRFYVNLIQRLKQGRTDLIPPPESTYSQPTVSSILVTVTKQDYFRYGKTVVFSPTGVAENSLFNTSLVCYPNPFSESTTISFSLDKSENVSLIVYDQLGKKVAVILDNSQQTEGTHKVQFSGKDLAKGIYSCVLKTDSGISTQNIVIGE